MINVSTKIGSPWCKGNWRINMSQSPICAIAAIHFELIVWHFNILLLLHFQCKECIIYVIPFLQFAIFYNFWEEGKCITSKKPTDICSSCFCIISSIPKHARLDCVYVHLTLIRIDFYSFLNRSFYATMHGQLLTREFYATMNTQHAQFRNYLAVWY